MITIISISYTTISSSWILFHTNLLSLGFHFLQNHEVVFSEVVTFNDFNQVRSIRSSRSISCSVYPLCPSFVVVGRKTETSCIAFVVSQELTMVFIRITHTGITTEFLIWFVICVQSVFSSVGNPGRSSFDAKVVVLISSQLTLSITTLQDSLG